MGSNPMESKKGVVMIIMVDYRRAKGVGLPLAVAALKCVVT